MGSPAANGYRLTVTSRCRPSPLRALSLLAGALAAAGCAGSSRLDGLAAAGVGIREDRLAARERAYLAIRQKRWPEAVSRLNKLIDDEPGDMRLRMERGYARQAAGALPEAADEFALIAREPGEFQAQALEALKVVNAQSTEAGRDMAVRGLIDAGYDDLRRGYRGEARDKFDRALQAEPGKTHLSKQLAYMSLADGDLVRAAERLEGVRRLAPFDYQTALELGYVYDSLHDKPGAVRSFSAALASPDPEVRATATEALRALGGPGGPVYLDVYVAPYWTSRFRNEVVAAEAQVGRTFESLKALSVYLAARWTRDSRSRGGSAPEIYSDNAVSLAPGLRLQPPGYSAHLNVEFGAAANVIRTPEHPGAVEAEARVLLADYRYWAGRARTFADLGGSVGFYSRHRQNVIAELQARAGFKVSDSGLFHLRLYAPLRVIKDVNRDFYNNVAEFGAGAEARPFTSVNLALRAEVLKGSYLGIAGRDPNPYGASYRDTRVMAVYTAHFSGMRPPPPPVRRRKHRLYLW